MHIDIQLNPAVESWPSLRDGVCVAEEVGFDTAWVFDHFAGAMLSGTSMLECFTLLGALGAATQRIGLGSLVVNIANRPHSVMAMSAASVQHISNGRLILGLGAGAAPNTRWSAEHTELGIDLGQTVAERHRRLSRALDELDRLWGVPASDVAATFPRPDPRPPVILGVNSARLAEMAGARCDGVNVRANHPELELLLRSATRGRDAAGRRDEPWDASVWAFFDEALRDPDHPDRQQWASLGVTRLVLVCLTPHDPAALTRFMTA